MVFSKTDMQLGLTKVFMRKGPHEKLESHRVFHQNASITLIQSWIRALQQEKRYLISASSALDIQRWYRGCLGRARYVFDCGVGNEEKYCSCTSVSTCVFSFNIDGGNSVKLRRAYFSQTHSECKSTDESTTACEWELFVFKLNIVDALSERPKQPQGSNPTGACTTSKLPTGVSNRPPLLYSVVYAGL